MISPRRLSQKKIQHLISIGAQAHVADAIVTHIMQKGTIMQRWRVLDDAQRILNSLHCSSWFIVGDRTSRIITALGGRQGCKFGGVIFNAVYEDSLAIVRTQAEEKGLILQLPLWDAPFWINRSPDVLSVGTTPVHEVQYVDDAVAMLFAHRSSELFRMILEYMKILMMTFDTLGLKINWARGKTEAMVQFRRQGATACQDRIACNAEGHRGIVLHDETFFLSFHGTNIWEAY